jgi:hypothetical protein
MYVLEARFQKRLECAAEQITHIAFDFLARGLPPGCGQIAILCPRVLD